MALPRRERWECVGWDAWVGTCGLREILTKGPAAAGETGDGDGDGDAVAVDGAVEDDGAADGAHVRVGEGRYVLGRVWVALSFACVAEDAGYWDCGGLRGGGGEEGGKG